MEELLKALRLIRDTCGQRVNCGSCPLCDVNEECVLEKEAPVHWELVDKVPETRLFK